MSATPTGDGGGRGRGRLIEGSGLSAAPGCGQARICRVSGANVETKTGNLPWGQRRGVSPFWWPPFGGGGMGWNGVELHSQRGFRFGNARSLGTGHDVRRGRRNEDAPEHDIRSG
jgi:hypothetical protein